ncbi:sugar porter family MFS transporter [Aspergillus stella-maris]|uniref:sugar porter family MFS transporter n=1 Tax=Aspergillus stella-maris TaxID=1810926 RepID=UPI003CCCF610
MHQADKRHLLQTVFVVFPCFFLFGYNQVVVGALVSFEAFTQLFPQLDTVHVTGAVKSHRSIIQGVYVSSFTLGCAVGAFSCSFIGDRLGRRKTICIGSVFTLIGEALSCTSFDLPQLFIGRILTGIGVGIFSTMVPVWQSESSPAINRGRHVVVDGIFITSGYAVSYWINYGFSRIQEHDVSWRVPLAIPGVLSIALCLAIFFFPESPRWLISIGRMDKATSELARLKGLDPVAVDITREVTAIEVSLESTAQKASTYRDIFTMKDGKLFYRVMLCVGLQFWIQMTGAQVISTYSTTIFQQNLNLSDGITRILAASAMTWKFLAAFISLFTIDRFGRRILFLICGVGVTTCMTCMAITTSFSSSNKAAAIASTFFVFLFNFFFPIGFLGPSFLYCTEVASARLRVAMTSIGTANHWLWNFLVQMVTPFALSSIGYKYYIVYAVIGLTYIISVYFFYPETMGQSLEQLEDLFQQDLSIRQTVRYANRLTGVSSRGDEEGRVEMEDFKGQAKQVEQAA